MKMWQRQEDAASRSFTAARRGFFHRVAHVGHDEKTSSCSTALPARSLSPCSWIRIYKNHTQSKCWWFGSVPGYGRKDLGGSCKKRQGAKQINKKERGTCSFKDLHRQVCVWDSWHCGPAASKGLRRWRFFSSRRAIAKNTIMTWVIFIGFQTQEVSGPIIF